MTDVAAGAIEAYERVVDALGNGEDRPGQRDMVAAVAQAFDSGQHLLVEAGTGTGKSIAYLVPAMTSGNRTIVATATKALQGQLIEKDLPAASLGLDAPVKWEQVKGRSSYACRAKLDDLGEIIEPELEAIVEWAAETATGDFAELEALPASRVLGLVSARSDECPGAGECRFGESCFSEDARRRAELADVVVANHHLLLADLRLKSVGASILPFAGQVVIDEAHRFEEAASSAFGAELQAGRFRYVTRLGRGLLAESSACDEIDGLVETAFDVLPGGRAQTIEGELRNEVVTAFAPLREALAALRAETRVIPKEGPAAERRTRLLKALASLESDLVALLTPTATDVTWVEGSPAGPRLRVAPIDVAPLVSGLLLDETTTVFTSATLASVGGFAQCARNLGLRPREAEREFDQTDPIDEGGTEFEALQVGSPFDFASNSLLYCAVHLSDPRSDSFGGEAREEIVRLIDAADGGAFCLFTSWRAMNEAYDEFEGSLDFPLFKQGDAPPERLVEQFVSSAPAVLLGTQTFWQGVDVPGDPLRLVVIDKIPFQPPDDPLVRARGRLIAERGGDAFREDALPRAALMLKQGAGRLIRTVTDRGVVAVLDRRLAATAYGRQIVATLPPMRRTKSFADVEAFFDSP